MELDWRIRATLSMLWLVAKYCVDVTWGFTVRVIISLGWQILVSLGVLAVISFGIFPNFTMMVMTTICSTWCSMFWWKKEQPAPVVIQVQTPLTPVEHVEKVREPYVWSDVLGKLASADDIVRGIQWAAQYFSALLVFFSLLCVVFLSYSMSQKIYKVIVGSVGNKKNRGYCDYGFGGYVPETMIKGSMFQKGRMPKFQCEIWILLPGEVKYVRAGVGFRVADKIYTACHVVVDAISVLLRTEFGEVEVSQGVFYQLADADLAYTLWTNETFQKLQLTSGKFSTVCVDEGNGTYVMTDAWEKRSMGLLTSNPSFGYVTYKGSTTAGFSGAPYYLNNTIYGLHLGSQGYNVGLDASYVVALIRSRQEDSAQYLERLLDRQGKGGKYDYKWAGDGSQTLIVRANGRYLQVAADSDIGARIMGMKMDTTGALGDDYDYENYSSDSEDSEDADEGPVMNTLPHAAEVVEHAPMANFMVRDDLEIGGQPISENGMMAAGACPGRLVIALGDTPREQPCTSQKEQRRPHLMARTYIDTRQTNSSGMVVPESTRARQNKVTSSTKTDAKNNTRKSRRKNANLQLLIALARMPPGEREQLLRKTPEHILKSISSQRSGTSTGRQLPVVVSSAD